MKKIKIFESNIFESNMFIADEVSGEIVGSNFKYQEGEDAKTMISRYDKKLGIDPDEEDISSDEIINGTRVIGVDDGRKVFWYFFTSSKKTVKDIIKSDPNKFANVIDIVDPNFDLSKTQQTGEKQYLEEYNAISNELREKGKNLDEKEYHELKEEYYKKYRDLDVKYGKKPKEETDLEKRLKGFRREYSELSNRWQEEYKKIMKGKLWQEATTEQKKEVKKIDKEKTDYEKELYKKWNVTWKDVTSN